MNSSLKTRALCVVAAFFVTTSVVHLIVNYAYRDASVSLRAQAAPCS